MSINIDKVLHFLSEPRRRCEVEEQFDLNFRQAHSLLVWLEKGQYAESFSAKIEGQRGKRPRWYIKKQV